MFWLDEDLRVDAQTSAQRNDQCELDVPIVCDGLQYYPTEGVWVDAVEPGLFVPESPPGGAGERHMADRNLAALEIGTSAPAYTTELDRQLGFRKTPTAVKCQPFSTSC